MSPLEVFFVVIGAIVGTYFSAPLRLAPSNEGIRTLAEATLVILLSPLARLRTLPQAACA